MSKTREVRELQLSSTQLIVLFLSILILGVFIFLLGVSVGKKQAALSQQAGLQRRPSATQVKRSQPVVPKETGPSPIDKEIASHSQQSSTSLPMSSPGGTTPKIAEPSGKGEAKPTMSASKPPASALSKESTQVKTPVSKTAVKPAPSSSTQTKSSPTGSASQVKSAVPVKGQYYIQLAAFEDRKGAEEYAANIKAAGFPTLILSPLATDRTPWYRVRVGGYLTKEDAEKAVSRLKAALSNRKLEYWITRE